MAKTIGQLTAESSPAGANEMPISVSNVTKKVSVTNLLNAAVNLTGKTFAEAADIAFGASTGTKVGTATTQKIGFWNATPVVQPALTADLLDSLQAVGLIASGAGNTPLDLTSGALTCGALTCGAVTAGAVGATSVASSGAVTSNSASAGVGYATGAGSTATQATDKSTGVTLNAACGSITLASGNISSQSVATFTLTNSAIAATDILVFNHVSGGTAGAYSVNAQAAAGSASINVTNISGSGKNEQPVIRFAVIKSVDS